jgi:cytochrome P450
MMPHLNKPRVQTHFESIRDVTCGDISQWPVNETVDLYALIREVAQKVALSILFGEQDAKRIRVLAQLLSTYHDANWRLVSFALPFKIAGLPYRHVLRLAEALNSFMVPWSRERAGKPRDSDLRAALTGVLDDNGSPITPEKLVAHFNFLAFASFETMSSALTWTLFLLALHPQVSLDLLDELNAAAPSDRITESEIAGLPLLDGVVKESLRLIPPTPVLPWRCYVARGEIAGFAVRGGTRIWLSPHLTHRLPQLYADPDRFKPMRWATHKPTPFEFIAFSAGPRRCPGSLFATVFMKLALATILPRFAVRICAGARVDRVFKGIAMPKAGIPVQLVPQDRALVVPACTGNIFDCVTVDPGAR